MKILRPRFLLICVICAMTQVVFAQSGSDGVVSRSFELRYISNNGAANGESDFKGPTSVLDTEQRVKYLEHYADYASRFFEDTSLETKAVSAEELSDAMARLKPQPLPQIRSKIRLDSWKRYTFREGEHEESLEKIDKWNAYTSAGISNDRLVVKKTKRPFVIDIPGQSWRFKTEFSIQSKGAYKVVIGNNAQSGSVFGIDEKHRPFFITEGETTLHTLKTSRGETDKWLAEIDLAEGFRRYNLYLNGELIADYVPLADTLCALSDRISILCEEVIAIESMRGVGYDPARMAKNIQRPYDVHTFLDEDFRVKPPVDGWMLSDYDDSLWEETGMPFAHGSERHKGEDIYLRKKVFIEGFQRVYFELESLFPSGELWVNGKIVEVIKTSHPQFIDITRYVKPDSENTFALKVNSFAATEDMVMHHAPTDMNIGWYAGRSALHITQPTHITDMYVFTRRLEGNKALMSAEVAIYNDTYLFYNGVLSLNMKEWFPQESDLEIVVDSVNVSIEPQQAKIYRLDFEVENPRLWSASTPELYSVRAILTNDVQGVVEKNYRAIDGDHAKSSKLYFEKLTDDYIVTTGIRTIDQDGGTFRINGKPELLKAPLFFGQRFPLDNLATYILCPPSEVIMEELLAFKKMGCNGARMSVHWSDNYGVDGTNDPRMLEMGDQLGLMYAWTTAAFIRVRTPFTMDFEGLGEYVRQARNSPSVVIWQPANHPDIIRWNEAMTYFNRVYDVIYPLDTTRLITPSADLRHIGPHNDNGTKDKNGNPVEWCDPVWTAHRIARGSMDYPTGYGQEWDFLRLWPFPKTWKGGVFMNDFIQSKERAYFNFEHEESAAQPNWKLQKGLPSYKLPSYEWVYDEGSIGRKLSFDEWRESQAWQAFSAYESIRKMRWLDYDGLSWCCMWGGPNMGTYQKPLLDLYGHKKLSYYTNRMGFQPVLAGSKDVDMIYGRGDSPELIVMNIGDERIADLLLEVVDTNGNTVYSKRYPSLKLTAGRSVNHTGRIDIPELPEGFYFFNYTVTDPSAPINR